MKFLFIVQGEGRGHLTQAITLEDMLQRNGHEVVEVLVGKSSSRTLPGFFNRSIHAPVKRFISPNFLPTTDNKRVNLKKSLAYNLLKLLEYFRSMYFINHRIKETGAEVVFVLDINICFYIVIFSFRIRVRSSYGCCVSLHE